MSQKKLCRWVILSSLLGLVSSCSGNTSANSGNLNIAGSTTTLTVFVQPWINSQGTLINDTSVTKDFSVQQINSDGALQAVTGAVCTSQSSTYLNTWSCTFQGADAAYLVTTSSQKQAHIFSLTHQHPTAGSLTNPVILTPSDTEMSNYLTSLIGIKSYQFQNVIITNNQTDPDPFDSLYQDYYFSRLKTDSSLTAYFQDEPGFLYKFLSAPLAAPLCSVAPSFKPAPWSPTGSVELSTCTFQRASLALATPTLCSNYAAPNSGALVLGEFSTTQFSSGDSISYAPDTISRTLALSDTGLLLGTGTTYFAVSSAKDVWLFSKCNNDPLLELSFTASTKASLTLSRQPSPLSANQTSHLQMLAVNITADNYSGLQSACSPNSDLLFTPNPAVLSPTNPTYLLALADWIGSSRCLCGSFWNYSMNNNLTTDINLGGSDNFNLVFPIGAPNVSISIKAQGSGVTGTFNTNQSGIGGFSSPELQQGDVISFPDLPFLPSCKLPTCPAFSILVQGACQACASNSISITQNNTCKFCSGSTPIATSLNTCSSGAKGQACGITSDCVSEYVCLSQTCQICPTGQGKVNNTCQTCNGATPIATSFNTCSSGAIGQQCESSTDCNSSTGICDVQTHQCVTCTPENASLCHCSGYQVTAYCTNDNTCACY